MKIFWTIAAMIVAVIVGLKIWAWMQAKKIAEIYPRKDEAQAAIRSAQQDAESLSALRMVLPPSAMNVRTTIGTIDANRIGGNVSPNTTLVNVNRWSPLGGNLSW